MEALIGIGLLVFIAFATGKKVEGFRRQRKYRKAMFKGAVRNVVDEIGIFIFMTLGILFVLGVFAVALAQ